MSDQTAEAAEDIWRLFIERPSTYVHPERLTAVFQGAIGEAGCNVLLGAARISGRLSKLLSEQLHLSDAGLAEIDISDRAVAVASPDEVEETILRSGAIYWSEALTRVILGRIATHVEAELGDGIRAYASEHRDLSGPEQSLEPIDDLRRRIVADGNLCFASWCAAMPDSISARVRLKLSPDHPACGVSNPAFAELGPKIVRRAGLRNSA